DPCPRAGPVAPAAGAPPSAPPPAPNRPRVVGVPPLRPCSPPPPPHPPTPSCADPVEADASPGRRLRPPSPADGGRVSPRTEDPADTRPTSRPKPSSAGSSGTPRDGRRRPHRPRLPGRYARERIRSSRRLRSEMIEESRQAAKCPMRPRFHGAEGDPELVRRLGVSQLTEERRFDHRLFVGRQAIH